MSGILVGASEAWMWTPKSMFKTIVDEGAFPGILRITPRSYFWGSTGSTPGSAVAPTGDQLEEALVFEEGRDELGLSRGEFSGEFCDGVGQGSDGCSI